MDRHKIASIVNGFETENEFGFNKKEIKKVLNLFNNYFINFDKYKNALNGITCMLNDDGEIIIYHCDIITAICCGIENRTIKPSEWD